MKPGDAEAVEQLFNEAAPSYDKLNDWLSLVLKSRKQTSDPPCGVLVGNKADLNQHATKVNENDVKHWAASKSFEYFEVSALPQGGTGRSPLSTSPRTSNSSTTTLWRGRNS